MPKGSVIDVGVKLQIMECHACFVPYAIPSSLQEKRQEDGGIFYCPNGHAAVYRDSEVRKLQRRLANAEDRANAASTRERVADNRAYEALRDLEAERKEARRLARRAKAGVCSACHRTFQNVQRHMKTKHGEPRDG